MSNSVASKNTTSLNEKVSVSSKQKNSISRLSLEPDMTSTRTVVSTMTNKTDNSSGLDSTLLSGVSNVLESDLVSEGSFDGTLVENESIITVSTVVKTEEDSQMGLLEQEYSGEIKESYSEIPIEYGLNKFNEVYTKWFGTEKEYRERSAYELMELGLKNLGLKNKRITHELLSKMKNTELFEIFKMFKWFKKQGLINEKHKDNEVEYSVLFNRILELVYYSEKCIEAMLRMQIATNPDYDSTMNDDPSIFRFEGYDTKTTTPFQTLVLYLLRYLHENQYRRYHESIYKMRFIENENGDKIFTYSWKEHQTIKEFVYNATCKETNYHQWKNATSSKSNINDAIKYLVHCRSEEFPVLVKDRHVFSFRNGVYITNVKNKVTGKFDDYFYRYNTSEGNTGKTLSSKVVAAKYFDLEFNNYDGVQLSEWSTVPTPYFDKILLYQFNKDEECDEICKWMYILIGKLMYNVKEMEGWQIMPYLMGMAGAGKSTICEIAKLLYEPSDIGMIENTIEEKFGLAPQANNYIVLAPEIKKNFALDQALFQKIISGEECALPQKNQDPLQMVWKAPMFMASNEPPGFADAAGSISRRLVVFKFLNIVKAEDSDPELMKKLELEMAAIIKKANMAYLDTVNNFGKKDIWSILPRYFKLTRDLLGQETNTLKHFLGSGLFEFDDSYYCSEKEFKDEYKKYCSDNGLTRAAWSTAVYEGPMAEVANRKGVKIGFTKGVSRIYPQNVEGATKRRLNFIDGLRFVKVEKESDNVLDD